MRIFFHTSVRITNYDFGKNDLPQGKESGAEQIDCIINLALNLTE